MKAINVLLIGVGPHANKVYLPGIQQSSRKKTVAIRAVVDLESSKAAVQERLAKHGYTDAVYEYYITEVTPEKPATTLSTEVQERLNQICEEQEINAVIISTDPIAHKAYALWALSRDLPILMDKPLTARMHTAHDLDQAKALYQDYDDLLTAYKASGSPVFSISSQRRYHPGFNVVFEKVAEILDRFHCPITAIQCTHADGQWRMPHEVISQMYHPYNIYGKVSHGGYHFIDTLANLIQRSYGHDSPKHVSDVTVYSSFIEARGLLKQLNQADYENIFGPEYRKLSPMSDEELFEAYKGYGEVDVASVIQLAEAGDPVCNITLNLMHNTFSRRSWLPPGNDLYKGNGRVKQEYFSIQQGPFQNIQIHSYQQNDRHESSSEDDYELGGNNHFDIYVFRNKEITGDKEALEVISMKDLANDARFNASLYIHDQVKFRVIEEFFDKILGGTGKQTSPLEHHRLSALLMSLIYQSGVTKQPVSEQLTDEMLQRSAE